MNCVRSERRSPVSKQLGGRWCVTAACGALICAAALHGGRASARSSGMVGYSGKQGSSCNQELFCHGGGVAPIVTFIGPDALDTCAMATFRFAVQSLAPEQPFAGFNVSA